jgi:hypothetical protein
MTTLHEELTRASLESLLKAEDGDKCLEISRRWLQELKKQGYQDYLDCIGQYFWRGPRDTDPAQLTACFTVHARLIAPYVTAEKAIETSGKPLPDARRRGNDAILADLPEPFIAEVPQRQGDSSRGDGILRWTRPIRTLVSTDIPLIVEHRPETCREKSLVLDMMRTLSPGRVPLEIGYTKASKTLYHLLCSGGVARWPYGQEEIRLWITLIRPQIDL